jgi:two-component system, OmpR family, response regulator QseB
MHILIVEDDRTIAENLYDFLEARGHQCDFATTLAGARSLLAASPFDALAVDRNLPDGDGATLVRSLRSAGQSLPILMLTARDQLDDKLDGFAAGADDYLVKPFALKEVEARLLALQRRAMAQTTPAAGAAIGGLSFDPAAHEIRLAGQVLDLPPKAVKLLATMLPHPDRLFSRRELEIAVWGHEQEASDNLRSVLHTVRKALGAGSPVEIRNVHGLGYKLVGA